MARLRFHLHPGIASALAAAALFGVSTPLAKLLVGVVPPVMLAGLLYLGSGVGLLGWFWARRLVSATGRDAQSTAFGRRDLGWLAAAIVAGGVVGPVLLMQGLMRTAAASASLLLNLEGVLTALLAWFVFRENVDRRVAIGMGLIVAGGVLLSWQGEAGFRAFGRPRACAMSRTSALPSAASTSGWRTPRGGASRSWMSACASAIMRTKTESR